MYTMILRGKNIIGAQVFDVNNDILFYTARSQNYWNKTGRIVPARELERVTTPLPVTLPTASNSSLASSYSSSIIPVSLSMTAEP